VRTAAPVVARIIQERGAKGLGAPPLLSGSAYETALDAWVTQVESGTPPADALVSLKAALTAAHPGRIHVWLWDKTELTTFTVPPDLLEPVCPPLMAAQAKLPRDPRLPVRHAVVIAVDAATPSGGP
jgi:hypothetical protein